jgi:hypothetical protein
VIDACFVVPPYEAVTVAVVFEATVDVMTVNFAEV